MRELTNNELEVVAGGVTGPSGSLTIGVPLGTLPTISFTFEGTQGLLSLNGGAPIQIGLGHPPVHLP